jgi:hypothetical protein
MKRKLVSLVITVLAFGQFSFAQASWHMAGDPLKLPPSPGSFYNAVLYLKKYDTVACTYKVIGNDDLRKGYKMVRIQYGFYTDNSKSLNVFFDERGRRIRHVEKFYFN